MSNKSESEPWESVIEKEIVWPVSAYDLADREFKIVAETAVDLARYVENWDCDSQTATSADACFEAVDALGRQLEGKISMLDIIYLRLKGD